MNRSGTVGGTARPTGALSLSGGGEARYILPMETVFIILLPIIMLATLGVLGAGVFQMIRGGNPRRSNKLMQMRVLLQGAALLVFALLMTMLKR